MTRDIHEDHARLEALRLERKAQATGLSVRRIVWEEAREAQETKKAEPATRLRLGGDLTEPFTREFTTLNQHAAAMAPTALVELRACVGVLRGLAPPDHLHRGYVDQVGAVADAVGLWATSPAGRAHQVQADVLLVALRSLAKAWALELARRMPPVDTPVDTAVDLDPTDLDGGGQ